MTPRAAKRGRVLIALLAFGPTVIWSQPDRSGVFRGTVRRDSTKGPIIAGVEVILEKVGTTRTTPEGTFAFRELAPGTYAVTVRHPSYRPQTGHVTVAHGDTVDIILPMEAVGTPLPRVTVVGEPKPLSIGMADFESRRAAGLGKFITTKDFEARPNATLTDVLRSHVPGVLFIQQPGGGFAAAGRGGASIPPTIEPPNRRIDIFGGVKPEDQCYMQVFVDGQRLYTYHRPEDYGPNPPKLEEFEVSNILGVEIYRGAAETPVQFNTTGSSCGTIVIWTGKR
jgi:hypothetical protein